MSVPTNPDTGATYGDPEPERRARNAAAILTAALAAANEPGVTGPRASGICAAAVAEAQRALEGAPDDVLHVYGLARRLVDSNGVPWFVGRTR